MTKSKKLGRPAASGGYLKVFLIALGAAALVFLPYVIMDYGYFLYYGDFNVQQIPFYQMCHDSILKGDVFWSWTTDLGANFIGSYSFYNLGSPFFWLTLPFPSEAVPYLMAPLLVLKFACAATTGYAFIKRFVKTQNYAVMAGLLYAFSGFSVYNVFFNHFHEPIVFFPLLLIGLEEYMTNNRRGVFAAAVFVNCFVNYFFFVGMVTFTIIYWFMRAMGDDWQLSLKKFLWLVFEAVLGVLMSAVLLLPSVLAIMGNPRTNSSLSGFSALFYGWEQRYGAILSSFFFPPDVPARPNFFPDANVKWASVAAWLPVFGMTGVIAFCQFKRGHWLKRVLYTSFIMAAVPIFNSAFFLFNSSYYARWFYMLTLMMALATVLALEDETVDFMSGFKVSAGITFAIAVLIGFLPNKPEEGEETTYGLMKDPVKFWVYVAIAAVCLVIVYLLLKYAKRNTRQFQAWSMTAVVCVSVLYSIYLLAQGKVHISETHNYIIPYCLNGGEDLDLPDDENYRVDTMNGEKVGMDNQAMFWQIPTIQAFHSIVPASIMEFYPTIGVNRDVGSRPEKEHYPVRSFLSARYQLNRQEITDPEELSRYTYIGQMNGQYVYENKNYIPIGFTYDSYITREQYDALSEDLRERVLLKAIVLEDEWQEKRYSGILRKITNAQVLDYSDDAFEQDCKDRAAVTCDTFDRYNTGFTATIDLPKENLVFFSVPFDDGWTAEVNGVPVAIEKTNVGFMAVRCSAGENTIVFRYMTPGLIPGAIISAAALLMFILYVVLMRRYDKRKAALPAAAPDEDVREDGEAEVPALTEGTADAAGPDTDVSAEEASEEGPPLPIPLEDEPVVDLNDVLEQSLPKLREFPQPEDENPSPEEPEE